MLDWRYVSYNQSLHQTDWGRPCPVWHQHLSVWSRPLVGTGLLLHLIAMSKVLTAPWPQWGHCQHQQPLCWTASRIPGWTSSSGTIPTCSRTLWPLDLRGQPPELLLWSPWQQLIGTLYQTQGPQASRSGPLFVFRPLGSSSLLLSCSIPFDGWTLH